MTRRLERKSAVKKPIIYTFWGVMYAICVGLSFVAATDIYGKVLLNTVGILFFLPPGYLLWRANKEGDKKTIRLLRIVSICVLVLAMALICLNFASANWSAQTGLTLYVMLVMFAAPIGCVQSWAMALFLWACVLMVTLLYPGRK